MKASRIVSMFLAFGCAWILVSDHAIDFFVTNAQDRTTIQSIKGVLFVAASALLIYSLIRYAERTQAALRAEVVREKDRLAYLLNVTPAVIYSLKPAQPGSTEFSVDYVGQNVEQVTGYSQAMWMNQRLLWRDHIHPDDLAQTDKAQQQLLLEGELRHEYRFRHADGSYRWIHDNLILLKDEVGMPAQVMGAWLDVTARKQAEMAILDSEQRYRALFEANPMPVWVYDLETLRFLSVNNAAVRKYGYSREEFLSMSIKDIRPPDEWSRLERAIDDVRGSKGPYVPSGAWRHRSKDGHEFWVEISGHYFVFEGRPSHLILANDVTDRKQALDRLTLIGHVFESSQEGICITDHQGQYISVNQSFTDITGYTLADVQGKTPALMQSGRHDKSFYEGMWAQLRAEGRWEGEIWNRRKTGEIYPEWLTISAIQDEHGRVQQYLGIFTETSSRKAAEERIQRLSNYDQLTNLPNRTLLQDRTKIALASARRAHVSVVLMQLNIDHFSHINESMGQDVGDQVLVILAKRLVNALRPEDTVSRLGSDNFIILLPHTTAHDVTQVAMRLMASVAEPLHISGQDIRLTASIGIAEYPENGADLGELMQATESAVRQAKREGRNTLRFFSHSMQEQVKEALAIERDLRFAVERNQLVLHYQAQVNTHTQRIVGVEALVRWQHPQWGLVSPGKFIPIAEESGLIREIGRWVLETAVNQNQRWREQGLQIVPVAINLSPAQFKDPGLRDSIIEVLRQSGLPGSMVELELTESVAMENSAFTISTINELKRLEVQLSIDDFGTGYSSLSSLKRFDIDKLKIDQSFVRGLNLDQQDEAIVKTVINLAKSLGLHTIAEGVETAEQLAFLQANGCHEAQGYLFSRPVPADDFAALLAKGSA